MAKDGTPWTTRELNEITAWLATVPPIRLRSDPTFALVPTRQGFTRRDGTLVRGWVIDTVTSGEWRTMLDPPQR